MTYEPITDNVDQAQARMVKRFKDKTNIDKIIDIRVTRIQLLEDVLNQMLNERAISNASGVQLNGLGEFFGEQGERSNRTDSEYRAYLQTLPAKLREAGQVDVLIDSLNKLTGSTSTLLQWFPRAVAMHIFVDDFIDIDDLALIKSSMEAIKAAGVRFDVGVQLNSSAFIFSDDVAGGLAGEGFSELSTGVGGGTFARLLLTEFFLISESGDSFIAETGETFISEASY